MEIIISGWPKRKILGKCPPTRNQVGQHRTRQLPELRSSGSSDFGDSGQDFGHSGQDFGHSGEDFGHSGQDFGHSGQDFAHSGQDFGDSREDFGDSAGTGFLRTPSNSTFSDCLMLTTFIEAT